MMGGPGNGPAYSFARTPGPKRRSAMWNGNDNVSGTAIHTQLCPVNTARSATIISAPGINRHRIATMVQRRHSRSQIASPAMTTKMMSAARPLANSPDITPSIKKTGR